MATPVTSSAQMVVLLEQQLADLVAAKTQALNNLALAQTSLSTLLIAGGVDVKSRSDAGEGGSEAQTVVSLQEKIDSLSKVIMGFANTERMLLEQLQDLQPFNIRQRLRVAGRLWRC